MSTLDLMAKTRGMARVEQSAPAKGPSVTPHAPGHPVERSLGNQGMSMRAAMSAAPSEEDRPRRADRSANDAPASPAPPGMGAAQGRSTPVLRKCKACGDEEERVQTKPLGAVAQEGSTPILRKCKACGDEEELVQTRAIPVVQREERPVERSRREGSGREMPGERPQREMAKAHVGMREIGMMQRSSIRIQRRVAIGSHDDEYEQEADRVADMVLSGASSPYTYQAPSIRPISGDLGGVQRSEDAGGARGGDAGFESRLARTRGGGYPLPTETRLMMERGFGYDFSSVRIHTGSEAGALNHSVNARAFTSGSDIYFAPGEYHPSGGEGRRLLAHELTHVVQQGGGSAESTGVQRKSKYGDCPPLGGTSLGDRFEQALRPANPATLITQGRVPGGITDITSHDKVGKPDLYMSIPALTLPGIKGAATTNLAPTAADYTPMDKAGAKSSGKISFSPTGAGGSWSGAFPQIIVGDIKPLSVSKAGEGFTQLSNYTKGYTDFVTQALKVFPGLKAPATPMVKNMTALTIPPGFNYDNFDTEIKQLSPSSPSLIVGNKRYWLAFNGNGLVYYFCLRHPFKVGTSSQELLQVFEALLPLKKSLRKRHSASFHQPKLAAARPADSGAGSSLGNPAAREEQGEVGAAAAPRKPAGRGSGGGAMIQRDKAKKVDWEAKRKEWEGMRQDWDKKHGKAFLEKKGNAPFIEHLEVNKTLASKGVHAKTITASKEDLKELKTVELWSGETGKQLIFWRSKLGGAFDVVADFLERMREKFAGFKKKLGAKLGSMNVSKLSGWKQKFLSVLTAAAKQAFTALLDALKDIFVNCMETVVDKILAGIGEELEGVDIVKDIQDTYRKVERFVTTVEKEFHDRFAQYDELIATLSDIRMWVSVIGDLVTAGRLIWQAISCLSPPAWGCLWGLAGQFAFSAVLSLLMEIQEFRDAINHSVLGIFAGYVGDKFKALMMWGLKQVGLDKYADPAACAPQDKPGSGGGSGLGLIASPFSGGASSDSEKLSALRAWEDENKDMLIAQTRSGLKQNLGLELTEQQMLDLLKFLKDSGWTPEEMQKTFGQGTAPPSFEELMAHLKKAKDAKKPEPPATDEGKPKDDTPSVPPPKDAPPDPQASDNQGVSAPAGEKKDDKDKGTAVAVAVPVLDAGAATRGGARGSETAQGWSLKIDARGGHTANGNNAPIRITIWVFRDGTHVLTLTNVSAIVVRRTFDPPSDEAAAKRLKIHYKLTEAVSLAPYFPDITLTGNSEMIIYGYLKWR